MSGLRDYLLFSSAHVAAFSDSRHDARDDDRYHCTYDYVQDRGVDFESAPLTEEERNIVDQAARRTGISYAHKECFYNAQLMSITSKHLMYVEGYANAALIPVLHGWLTINGKVVDMTWRWQDRADGPNFSNRIYGVLPPGYAYIGVEMDQDAMRVQLLETGIARSMIDDWKNGFPLVTASRRIGAPLRETEAYAGSRRVVELQKEHDATEAEKAQNTTPVQG